MIPETTPEWLVWKLTAMNDKTHRFSEAEIRVDLEYDLGKAAVKELPRVLDALLASNTVQRKEDKLSLVGKEVYTRFDPGPIAPLEISDETIKLQKALWDSANAEWRKNPHLFWIIVNGKLRMGTPLDAFDGKIPRALRNMPATLR